MELNNYIASGDLYDVYRCGDKAVRVYKEEKYKEKCLYAALTHARVETTLSHADIKIPVLREVTIIDGKWATVMDWVEGKSLGDLIDENPEKTDMYLDKLVDIQCELQKQSVPLLSKLKDKLARQIKALDEIDEITRYELLTRLDAAPKHMKLCHNNFSPDCVMVNDDGVYVYNWGSSRQGNASADAAKTYLLLSLRRPALAEPYLNKFCIKSGIPKTNVQQWLPIVAAAQLDRKIESEKSFLMRWLDVVDYS